VKGWGGRNARFIGRVLLPEIFRRRRGISHRPDLALPEAPCRFKVTWIGHASFLIQTGLMNILVDPNWAKWLAMVKRVRMPGVHIDHLPGIDVVLVTHAHFDHLHVKSLRKIADGQPILVPKGVGKIVQNRGFGQVVEMEYWDQVRIGELLVTFTPSKHWGARMVHDVHRGFGGFLIQNDAGRSVYHCGDSAYFDGFLEIGQRSKIDLALMPIGAYEAMSGRTVHMNPEEAFDAFRDLGAGHMVPMHYGTFPLGGEPMHEPLERFRQAARHRSLEDKISILTEGHPALF
jgi:L-ascorbate metabolism protein UlaG (beta-lactamase superfamily)